VSPGTVIRIKIDRPIDLSSYQKAEKRKLMEDVFQIMSRNLAELKSRSKPEEERHDPIFRWIHKN
jgi:hypothetical protein